MKAHVDALAPRTPPEFGVRAALASPAHVPARPALGTVVGPSKDRTHRGRGIVPLAYPIALIIGAASDGGFFLATR